MTLSTEHPVYGKVSLAQMCPLKDNPGSEVGSMKLCPRTPQLPLPSTAGEVYVSMLPVHGSGGKKRKGQM